MTTSLHAQLTADAGQLIRQLQTDLEQLIATAAHHIAEAESLSGALTSRGIKASAKAALYEDIVSVWVEAQGATIPDIEEALARSDIRTTGVYPGIRETEIRTQPHGDVPIFIAHADIPAPAL